jgi:hypothetical protein
MYWEECGEGEERNKGYVEHFAGYQVKNGCINSKGM